MSRRLYIGKLSPDTRSDDVTAFLNGCGTITDCRVMTGFGFVEFENAKDAEDVVQNFNGKRLMGSTIVVEFAKESRPRREPYTFDRYRERVFRPPPGGWRVIVSGVSRDTSWQDLKDFARDAGPVTYADIDRDGQGVLEYPSREDAERAVKELDGKELRGRSVHVNWDDSRHGADNYRRDERRSRRDRSYSHGRHEERRRSRSPTDRRVGYRGRDYDDRDSRRRDDLYERVPEEKRRNDDKGYEYKNPRLPSGDEGWPR